MVQIRRFQTSDSVGRHESTRQSTILKSQMSDEGQSLNQPLYSLAYLEKCVRIRQQVGQLLIFASPSTQHRGAVQPRCTTAFADSWLQLWLELHLSRQHDANTLDLIWTTTQALDDSILCAGIRGDEEELLCGHHDAV